MWGRSDPTPAKNHHVMKNKFPARDGWLHIRFKGSPITQEKAAQLVSENLPVEVGHFKAYKTRTLLICRTVWQSPELLVQHFNNLFPVGSTVMWRLHEHQVFGYYIVHSEAFVSEGQPVVFLKGYSGFVSIRKPFVSYRGRS